MILPILTALGVVPESIAAVIGALAAAKMIIHGYWMLRRAFGK